MTDETQRILIVDDQPHFAAAVAKRLQLDGHQATVADSAAAGLACCLEQRVDTAFVDLALPDGQGTELAAAIKRRHPAAFVVLMTGFATRVDDEELASAAIDAILPKPWRGAELEDVLGRAMRFNANRPG